MTPTETARHTLESIVANRLLDGYAHRAPSRLAQAVDSGVCAGATCEACDWTGLAYAPFTHPTTGSYRAFMLCPRCGQVEEF